MCIVRKIVKLKGDVITYRKLYTEVWTRHLTDHGSSEIIIIIGQLIMIIRIHYIMSLLCMKAFHAFCPDLVTYNSSDTPNFLKFSKDILATYELHPVCLREFSRFSAYNFLL